MGDQDSSNLVRAMSLCYSALRTWPKQKPQTLVLQKEGFGKGTTVLGLMMATEVIQELECLNCTLQKQTETVSGMLSQQIV